MLPGPELVYECPNCTHLIKVGSLRSGNTFGAKIFSNGKTISPMLPDFPDLTKCKKCDSFFWISKLKEIGFYNWGDTSNPEWENADNAEFLSTEEYFRALETDIAENENEKLYIRQKIWWSFNDRVREGYDIFKNDNEEILWRKNCIALKELLDEKDDNQKIMIAEIYRNLGQFDSCIELLDSITEKDLEWLKDKFKSECEKQNKLVFPLN